MPAIVVCSCCGESPDDYGHDEAESGEVPSEACDCGANAWEIMDVDDSELEDCDECPGCGADLDEEDDEAGECGECGEPV